MTTQWMKDCEEFGLKHAPNYPVLYYHLSLINALAKLPEESRKNFRSYVLKYVVCVCVCVRACVRVCVCEHVCACVCVCVVIVCFLSLYCTKHSAIKIVIYNFNFKKNNIEIFVLHCSSVLYFSYQQKFIQQTAIHEKFNPQTN